jgi:hypothetical protein
MGLNLVLGNGRALSWRIGLITLIALLLAGCGSPLLSGGKSASNADIWSHRDQFVRLEPQGASDEALRANDHPVDLSPELIRSMFGSLDVQFEDKKDETLPVFTPQELEILGDAISSGLAKAKPKEDVTFVIAGVHRSLISFTTDRAFIGGRVFFQDEKLNLIIGSMHIPYGVGPDRRLYPYETGSRKLVERSPRRAALSGWQILSETGLSTKTSNGKERSDWLVMNPDPQLWQTALAEKKEAKETAKDAFREASEVRETSTQLEAEQLKLRNELQEMKQTIQEMQQTPATAPAAVTAPATQAPEVMTKIEERLETLQRLKSKGLITDQEFQAKRQKILDGI